MSEIKLRKDGLVHVTRTFTEGEPDPGPAKVTWEGKLPPMYLHVSNYFLEGRGKRTVCEGRRIPPWYYGLAYESDYGREAVFVLLPFVFIIRALRWLNYKWGWIRTRPSYLDVQVYEAYQAGRKREHALAGYYEEHIRKLNTALVTAAGAIESAADAIDSLDPGDIDEECADNREFAAELRKLAAKEP